MGRVGILADHHTIPPSTALRKQAAHFLLVEDITLQRPENNDLEHYILQECQQPISGLQLDFLSQWIYSRNELVVSCQMLGWSRNGSCPLVLEKGQQGVYWEELARGKS